MPTIEEKTEFSLQIEILKNKHKLTYMDCILLMCEENAIDIEAAATLISPNLKSKITEEAESLNMLKTKGSRLPL